MFKALQIGSSADLPFTTICRKMTSLLHFDLRATA
jgi:hypothetical protein